MATTDVAPLVTPTYTAALLVPNDGSTLTQALLTNLIVALANRTEFLRDITIEASDNPESYCVVREDFLGAIFTSSQSRLDATLPWRTIQTGNVSINGQSGNSKNPGRLQCSVPGDGGSQQYFGFHLIGTTATPFSFATFQQMTVVVRINEDAANVTEFTRFGLVDDAEQEDGGTDALCIIRQPAANATKWMLMKNVSGTLTKTAIAAADFTDNEFATWRFVKNASNGVDFYLDGVLVHTVASGDLPTGGCNASFYQSVTAADTEVLTVDYDLITVRTKPTARDGA